jgi:hypothetical protein
VEAVPDRQTEDVTRRGTRFPRRMWHPIGALIGCLLVLTIVPEIQMRAIDVFQGKWHVATLRIDEFVTVRIGSDLMQEGSACLWYAISAGRNQVCRWTGFGFAFTPDECEFRLLTSDQSTIVGVVESSRPHAVLILYDRANGQRFPDSTYEKEPGRELFDRFVRESGFQNLEMGIDNDNDEFD